MKSMFVSLAVVIVAAGCSPGPSEAFEYELIETLDAFCDDPQALDGELVRLRAELVVPIAECTQVACDQACCNACTTTFALPCPSGDVPLEAAPGFGQAVSYGALHPDLSPEIAEIASGLSTYLGCVGPDCDPKCSHDFDAAHSFVADVEFVDGEPVMRVTGVLVP